MNGKGRKRFKLGRHVDVESSIIDRISDLPDSLIQRIFSFLPAEQLVRSSVLSNRWRYLWLTSNSLDFYLEDFSGGPVTIDIDKGIYRFCNLVNHVLLRHDRFTDVINFRMSWLAPDEPRDSNCMSSWISFVLGHKVENLDLHISFMTELPFSLFTCVSLKKFSLKFLTNEFVCLPYPPPPVNLLNLKHLSFHSVNFRDKDKQAIQALFSDSPNLETMVLEDCDFRDFDSISLINSQIKCLIINHGIVCRTGILCNYGKNIKHIAIDISAPRLEQLKLIHRFGRSEDCYVLNIPAVVEAFIEVEFSSITSALVKILTALGNAQTIQFELSGSCLLNFSQQDLLLLERSMISFPKLKSLTLPDCVTPWVEFLLNCCPNIESLVLHFNKEINYGVVIWKTDQVGRFSIVPHLKSVCVEGFEANEDQVEFLHCLMEKAVILEKLTICTNEDWNDLVRKQVREFEENLSTFSQASPNVSVAFECEWLHL